MAGLQWPILGLRGPISGSRGPIQGPGPSKVSGVGGGTRFCLREGFYSTRPFHGQFHTRRQSSGCAAVYKGKDQISQINRHELSVFSCTGQFCKFVRCSQKISIGAKYDLFWSQVNSDMTHQKRKSETSERTCGKPLIVFFFGCFYVCASVPILASM